MASPPSAQGTCGAAAPAGCITDVTRPASVGVRPAAAPAGGRSNTDTVHTVPAGPPEWEYMTARPSARGLTTSSSPVAASHAHRQVDARKKASPRPAPPISGMRLRSTSLAPTPKTTPPSVASGTYREDRRTVREPRVPSRPSAVAPTSHKDVEVLLLLLRLPL